MDKLKQPAFVKKGAEASLYVLNWQDKHVIIKKRLPKKYRPSKLDEQIRTYRTAHEPHLLHEARKSGVPTPLVYQVDMKNATITMEFVEGKQIKALLSEVSESQRINLCLRIGEAIGKLHKCGIVHGDLTTSNMILNPDGMIVFVDFGLGEKTSELEAKAVDLHLMKRALQSTHFRHAEECFKAVTRSYSRIIGGKTAKATSQKIREIERRGRYIAERKV